MPSTVGEPTQIVAQDHVKFIGLPLEQPIPLWMTVASLATGILFIFFSCPDDLVIGYFIWRVSSLGKESGSNIQWPRHASPVSISRVFPVFAVLPFTEKV